MLKCFEGELSSFKPCYKWITFNTERKPYNKEKGRELVLNLVINGLPSIPKFIYLLHPYSRSFKPCYKWINFNTHETLVYWDNHRKF